MVDTASIVINLIDVRCGNNNDKVAVCHNDHTICVASAAVQDHLDYSDHLGACSTGFRTTTGTGISTQPAVTAAQLAVYPNPLAGRFVVNLEGFKPGKAAMIVVDGNGRQLLQRSIAVSPDKQTIQVNLDNCATGLYFIKVITSDETKIKKLIIKR